MIVSLDSKLTPFGGLHLIHKRLSSKRFGQFIDKQLGSRVKTVGYNYSDLILTRLYTTFCGGSATEDVNYIRAHTLEQLHCFKTPSPDTILRGDWELATCCNHIETISGMMQEAAGGVECSSLNLILFLINLFLGQSKLLS